MTLKKTPWPKVELQDICKVESGSTPRRSKEKYWKDGQIHWATPTDITENNSRTISDTKDKVTVEGLESCSTSLLPPGSILLTSRATIGEAKINTVPMCTNQGFKSLVPKDNINNWYLYYQMNYLKNEYTRYGKGSVFLEVNKSDSEKFEIPLPPLPEQRTIADVLSTVDETIEQTRRLIAKLKKVKKGMMQDLFTRGIGDDGQLRPKPEDAPELYQSFNNKLIPKAWEIIKSSKIASFYNGRAYKLSEWEDTGVPVIRLQNLTGTGNEYYYSTMNLQLEKYCYSGDLLYMWSASFGPHIWKGPKAIYHYHIWKINCKGNLNKKFFYYELVRFTKSVLNQAQGSTMSHITKTGIENRLIPLPGIEEQIQIKESLDSLTSKINIERKKVEKLELIKKALMQDLLTGKVRTTGLAAAAK